MLTLILFRFSPHARELGGGGRHSTVFPYLDDQFFTIQMLMLNGSVVNACCVKKNPVFLTFIRRVPLADKTRVGSLVH